MKKRLNYRHRLITEMPMQLLMFLIQEEALSRFIDNVINLNEIEMGTNNISIHNAFSWRDDKRFYIVGEELIVGVEYWVRLYKKYSRECEDRRAEMKEIEKRIDKMF